MCSIHQWGECGVNVFQMLNIAVLKKPAFKKVFDFFHGVILIIKLVTIHKFHLDEKF